MPLNQETLFLDPAPQSVQRARHWVTGVLADLGRDDLLDSAELGVSELVTNAILHADPPILVRIRGTKAHPRVEVRDHSKHPPEINTEMTPDDSLLATIGRGLGLVAMYSSIWGSEVATNGKTVWFEPRAETSDAAITAGDVFDFAQYVERRVASTPPPEQLILIVLLNLPVRIFASCRLRYAELRRELRLLAISHGDEYPLTSEISELFLQVERERRQSRGVQQIDEAMASGLEHVDLEYRVPMSAPVTMTLLLEMLERADEFCRDEKLLALASSPQQREVQRWYLTEFSRQAAGESPRQWSGGLELDDSLPTHG